MTATLSPAVKVRWAESSSPTLSAFGVPFVSDSTMAWLLADAADVCLTGHERTMAFVELGCGEDCLAIKRILHAVMSSRMTLPVAIFDRLTRWLDGYAGSPEEPQLRSMIAQLRAQRFQPLRLRTQQAQRGDILRTAPPACVSAPALRR